MLSCVSFQYEITTKNMRTNSFEYMNELALTSSQILTCSTDETTTEMFLNQYGNV